MTFENIEKGVLIMQNGLAWGTTKDSDPGPSAFSWLDPCLVELRDPRYCTRATCKGDYFYEQLKNAEVVHVTRKVVVDITDHDNN